MYAYALLICICCSIVAMTLHHHHHTLKYERQCPLPILTTQAATTGNAELLKALLDHKADINMAGQNGATAIMLVMNHRGMELGVILSSINTSACMQSRSKGLQMNTLALYTRSSYHRQLQVET